MINKYLNYIQETTNHEYNLKPFDKSYYKSLPDINNGMLYDPDKGQYFILCKGNIKLGIIGVIILSRNFWQIYIDKKYRGLGLVEIGSDLLVEKLNLKELVAIIEPENQISLKAHKNAGFIESDKQFGRTGTISLVKKYK